MKTEFTENEIMGGWAMRSYEKELRDYVQSRYKEVCKIQDQIKIEKTPAYGQGKFSGQLIGDDAKKLSPSDIAIYADHGNFCFGGYCQISGNKFSGAYFTD